VYSYLGFDHIDWQRSFAYREKAATLYRQVGDRRSQVNLLCLIALYRALNGDLGLAQNYLDEAAMLFPLDRQIEGWLDFKNAKSIMALEHGDYEQARTLLQEVLVQSEKSGNRTDYLWAQARCGHLALREGNIREAREILAETAQEFQKNKEPTGVVFTMEGMAGLFVAIGSPKDAAQLIGWADARRKEINDQRPLLEQRDIDKVIATCITRMGEVAFADVYDEGQLMTQDEVVALALNEP
jgi:tetratricopeptide (TPR) repeat protein